MATDGKKKVRSLTLSAGKRGQITIILNKLKRFEHEVEVLYLGSAVTTPSNAMKLVIRASR